MIDFETREFIESAVADTKEFITIHRASLIELGFVLAVNALVAGGMLYAAQSAPAPETACEPQETRQINGALDMPKVEDERAWQWPLAEESAPEEIQEDDEPRRRIRRHRRRG